MHFSKESNETSEHKLSRRHFLKLGILAAVVSVSPYPSFAAIRDFLPPEKSLSFYNIHTGESLRTVYWYPEPCTIGLKSPRNGTCYWTQGRYLSEALHDINYIMRDHRTNEIKPIDTRLLDLLYAIHVKLKTRQYFHIISGFRSPVTNALLRKYNKGVAMNSLHMYGKAADIRVPKVDLSLVRRVAMNKRGGGVGYYPKSNFVHVDVGEVHYW